MKATLACAALVAGASAGSLHHRHNHAVAHAKRDYETEPSCECTTVYSTIYGEPTLVFPSVPAQSAPATSSEVQAVVPTPVPQTISSTGVYTFPATTITLTQDTTIAVPYETSVPAGTHTLGGVTTVVDTPTTVVCPYATVSTSNGVETSVIASTTYVCPSAGTYTIAPTTTVVPSGTTVTVPVVTSYPAGTYTQPEVVTTVYETSTVIYCPFAVPTPSGPAAGVPTTVASVPSAPVSAIPSAPVSAIPTAPASAIPSAPVSAIPSVSVPVSVPVNGYESIPTSAPVSTSSVPAEKPATSSTVLSQTPKPSTGSGSVPAPGVPGKPWAVTYTPYETSAGGGCKSQDQVNHDIAAIAAAGITTIRVYSTDCSTLDFVGSACEEHGVKMILGIFIDQPGCGASNPTVSDQLGAMKTWGKWDLVDLISVGNEAVLNGFCTPAELAGLITSAKQELSYTGPYSTAETVNIWQQQDFLDAVCPVVDMVGANAHAFFNTQTTAEQAGQFVKGQLDIIESCCPGKEGRIMETGWPSAGQALGMAVPGTAEQAAAVKSIVETVGDKAVLFSLTSDAWKSSNTACQCEQYWGCASVLGINL